MLREQSNTKERLASFKFNVQNGTGYFLKYWQVQTIYVGGFLLR